MAAVLIVACASRCEVTCLQSGLLGSGDPRHDKHSTSPPKKHFSLQVQIVVWLPSELALPDGLNRRPSRGGRANCGPTPVSSPLSAACGRRARDDKEPAKPGADLDFWVGTWKVYSGGRLDGVDVVEKEVAGFAVIENWKDSSGSTGKSLFYFIPAKKQWKQVWVTEAGVYKEKLSESWPDGIRFAGHVFLPDGREIQDRTTLTRMPNGDVHQVIEFTKDGKKWQTSYDAIYKRSQ